MWNAGQWGTFMKDELEWYYYLWKVKEKNLTKYSFLGHIHIKMNMFVSYVVIIMILEWLTQHKIFSAWACLFYNWWEPRLASSPDQIASAECPPASIHRAHEPQYQIVCSWWVCSLDIWSISTPRYLGASPLPCTAEGFPHSCWLNGVVLSHDLNGWMSVN